MLTLPLSAAGMLLAHQLTWRVAAHGHEDEVAHGYLSYGVIFLALLAAVVVVAATRRFIQTVGSGSVASVPSAGLFAIMPIVGFVLQEHLEHLVAAREMEATFFLSQPFVVGLLLQVPFALAAMIVARLILGVVETVATVVRTVGAAPWLRALEPVVVAIPSALHGPPPRRGLAFASAGRAPPLPH